MIKLIKNNWRKSKNFNSAFIASMIVSFFFGKYISILLNYNLPKWTYGWEKSSILGVFVVFLLYVAYKTYEKYYGAKDLIDMQNFYDNFFISLIVVIVSTLMILYNSYFPKTIYWLGTLIIILIIYFPLNGLYIKCRA